MYTLKEEGGGGNQRRERTTGRRELIQKGNLRQGERAREPESKAKQTKNRVKSKRPGFKRNIFEHYYGQYTH